MFCPSLPSPQYRMNAFCYATRVKYLIGGRQSALNRHVIARIEVVRFIVFSAIEVCVHTASAICKFGKVVRFSLFLNQPGMTRGLLLDVKGHMARAIKVSMAILIVPTVGVLRPSSAVELCRTISVGVPSQGRLVNLIRRVNIVSALSLAMIVICPMFLIELHKNLIKPFEHNTALAKVLCCYLYASCGLTISLITIRALITFFLVSKEVKRLRLVENLFHTRRETEGANAALTKTAAEVEFALRLMGLNLGYTMKELKKRRDEMALKGPYRHTDKGGENAKFQELARCFELLKNNQ